MSVKSSSVLSSSSKPALPPEPVLSKKEQVLDDDVELATPQNNVNIKRLLRRIDWRVVPFLCLIQMASYLDRVNIGQAKLYGLEKDLHLEPHQFSWSLSVFFISYLLFEVPSNLMLKKASPPRWMALIMFCWGVTTICMAAVKGFYGLMICRLFLGAFEAGVFPGIVLYLSFWYPRGDQGSRISFVTCASSLASAISGPISYLLHSMSKVGGLSSWQWIFICEGIPTVLIAIMTGLLLPASPQKAQWLSHEEQTLLKENSTHSSQEHSFDSAQFIGCFTDYKTYLYIVCYFGLQTPVISIAMLLPTIIRDMGFENTTAMLLTAPPYVAAMFFNLLWAWHSDYTMDRCFHTMAGAFTTLFGFILMLATEALTPRYIGAGLVVVGVNASLAPALSWCNNNLVGATKSATSIALVVMFGNLGGVFAGHFYRPTEAPLYIQSHLINVACLAMSMLSAFTLRCLLARENCALDTSPNPSDPTFRYVL
ncbi:hypothetical protein DSO57_1029408 [Entomophthora muscae]|uniref:Uncharacterized protein n=1 Tax=Entomophthora muscae TaxID=34485 RepID=A0ACC2TZP7_9FUNG|nr:hypothetical protein DSO57_1029408 [Entomophthora muscae]